MSSLIESLEALKEAIIDYQYEKENTAIKVLMEEER